MCSGSLGLPIIDWRGKDGKHKWRSSSEEGACTNMASMFLRALMPFSFPAEFLFGLGLRQHPPTEIILGIAARGRTTKGDRAGLLPRQPYAEVRGIHCRRPREYCFRSCYSQGREEISETTRSLLEPRLADFWFPYLGSSPEARRSL
jgi:hypothetical protein